MNREKIQDELRWCTDEQLRAIVGILQFNLRGLFIGDIEEAREKLRLVGEELERRKQRLENSFH